MVTATGGGEGAYARRGYLMQLGAGVQARQVVPHAAAMQAAA